MGLIVAAVVAIEAVAYLAGGISGVKVMAWTVVACAALFGVIYAVCWLIDYLDEREEEDEYRD